MKKILFILSVLMMLSCEKPGDCIESLGDITTKEVEVTDFRRIEIHKGIELVITEGPVYKVVIESGENIIDDIEVTQNGNTLSCRNNNTCNWVREYGVTKVHITAPNIEEVYSKSERNVSSVGTLHYPSLSLYAIDSDGDGLEGAGTGDFFINVAGNNQLVVQTNNVARFYLSGSTQNAVIEVYAGDSRIEAQDLIAQDVNINLHRGSNDIIVRPIVNLKAKLVSTGNVICIGHPLNTPDVQQLYQGELIFQ